MIGEKVKTVLRDYKTSHGKMARSFCSSPRLLFTVE